jgi:hypothetical protein
MAILKGFSPSNTISPAIHISSKDLASPAEGYSQTEWDNELTWINNGSWKPIKPKQPQFTVEIIEEEEWK